jgi:tetratricopeptide (TPR) repeat protein
MSIGIEKYQISRAYEAAYLDNFSKKNWVKSLENARCWLSDQPFSSTPACSGSYVASCLLEDFAAGKEIATQGLIANKSDKILLNNLAFCLVNLGEIDPAVEALKIAKGLVPNAYEIVPITATEGLIDFKMGDLEAARSKYGKAVDLASAPEQRGQKIAALANWAKEEALVGSVMGINLLNEALELAKDVTNPDVSVILENSFAHVKRAASENS